MSSSCDCDHRWGNPNPMGMVMPSSAAADATAAAAPALYVGDLHRDVTNTILFEFFSSIGDVISVRVCTDSYTNSSLGYGYVNYKYAHDAINAIEKLNHNLLCGMPIRIMWSHRDLDSKIIGIGNVFVENLCESTDSMKLRAMFGKFGNILSSKVVIENWKGNGYGFVQFDSQDSANDAINNLNDTIIDGKKICVGNFTKNSERLLYKLEAKCTSLYLQNLDQDITEDLILLKFSIFGKISNVIIARDVEGNSLRFGFVKFENPESAKKAFEAMNEIQLGLPSGSNTLNVARAQNQEEQHQTFQPMNEQIRKNMASSNLYVKNIGDSVDDNALQEHFSQCGTITSAKVMRNEKGINKGFGFVCYSTLEEAINAVNKLNGYMFHGKPLYVSIAQRKKERQAQLQVQYAQQMVGFAGSAANVIPTWHPPLYHSPPEVMPQLPPPQGLMYQPFGLRPEWKPAGFVPPPRPTFQPMSRPVISNTPKQQWQKRGRMNSHFQMQQPKKTKCLQIGRQTYLNNVSPALSDSSNPQGMIPSSMLAAAPLQ